MTLTNKIIISAVATLVFGGLLFFSPLKNSAPSSSILTLLVMALAIVSLVCFLIFLIKALMPKKPTV